MYMYIFDTTLGGLKKKKKVLITYDMIYDMNSF